MSVLQAAEAYDRHFVPALFQDWAGPVVDAAGVTRGQRVLDVACGTGVVAREALARVGPQGKVAGLDVNAAMLAVASRRASQVEWTEGRAESLPFEDRAFDAVLCQFGLMFFEDRVAALREMSRVLVPGGRIAIAVWESLEHNIGFAKLVSLLDRHAGARAADALRVPFSLGDASALAGLLAQGELAGARIGTHPGRARFPSLDAWLEMEVKGWLPIAGVTVADTAFEALRAAAQRELAGYVREDGTVELPVRVHIVTFSSQRA